MHSETQKITEKVFLLPESLKNMILNYLFARPCGEVLHAVNGLMNVQEEAKPEESVSDTFPIIDESGFAETLPVGPSPDQ